MILSAIKLIWYEFLYRVILHCYMLPALWYLGVLYLQRDVYHYLDFACVTFMGVTFHFYLVRRGVMSYLENLTAAQQKADLPDFPENHVSIHEVAASFIACLTSMGTYVLRHRFVDAFWTLLLMGVLQHRVTNYLKGVDNRGT